MLQSPEEFAVAVQALCETQKQAIAAGKNTISTQLSLQKCY